MPEGPECHLYADSISEKFAGCKLLKMQIIDGQFTKDRFYCF